MTTERNKLIGERVRFYRTSRDISLKDLTSQLTTKKITLQQFSNYETGEARWPADLACEVAAILNVDIRLITGMEESGRSSKKFTEEWEAERAKVIILSMRPIVRAAAYEIIKNLKEL